MNGALDKWSSNRINGPRESLKHLQNKTSVLFPQFLGIRGLPLIRDSRGCLQDFKQMVPCFFPKGSGLEDIFSRFRKNALSL